MKIRTGRIGLLIAAIAVLVGPSVAAADEWAPAQKQDYFSSDHRFRLTVVPRAVSNPLNYFTDKVAGTAPAGQAKGDVPTYAEGILAHVDDQGRWQTVWDKPLANDVAPVSAIVSASGAYVVTFDDWFSVGRGQNVVAIYGGAGQRIRSLRLDEIISPQWIATLPASVSSTYWSGDPRLEEPDRLVLNVMAPGSEAFGDKRPSYVELKINLSSGQVIVPRTSSWRDVNTKALKLAAAKKRDDDEAERKFLNPIQAPKDGNRDSWRYYLSEIYYRNYFNSRALDVELFITDDYSDGRPPEDYVRKNLNEPSGYKIPEVVVIGSNLSADRFVSRIKEFGVKPGVFQGQKVLLVADQQHSDQLRALLAPSGADITIVDPMTPIPQPVARIRAHNGEDLPEN